VFGANGRLGQRVVEEAQRRGHEVTAVVRDAASLHDQGEGVRVEVADVSDPSGVASAVADQDAVISTVGRDEENPTFVIEAAGSLLAGLARAGVPRLVFAGGAGSLLVAPGTRLVDTPDFPEEYKAEAQAHAQALELFRDSDTEVRWTYVSPGALLAPGERRGTYRTAGNDLLVDEEGHSHISMEDFAIALLDEVEQPRHVGERFHAAY